MDSEGDDCYGEVKEEEYVSENGNFSLDHSRNAGQQQIVLEVQPWRELGFSALDDDLPLTTVLTCVSTGQRADRPHRPDRYLSRWQGGGPTRGLGPPMFVTGLTRVLPQPQLGPGWRRVASGTNMPRGPAVKPAFPLSSASASLCYQAISRVVPACPATCRSDSGSSRSPSQQPPK